MSRDVLQKEETKMRELSARDRLFGTISVFFLVAALLVPWIIAVLPHGEEKAVFFGLVAGILALLFGIIGWRNKSGKLSVCVTGGLLCIALVMRIIFSAVVAPRREAAMLKIFEMEKCAMEEQRQQARENETRRMAEQSSAGDVATRAAPEK